MHTGGSGSAAALLVVADFEVLDVGEGRAQLIVIFALDVIATEATRGDGG